MMFKSCSKCGKIHSGNYKCSKGTVYAGGEERKLRAKYAWAKKSKEIRERASNLCEVCRDKGIYTYNNLEVHHIEKLKENPQGLLDDNNLVCLCVMHHKQADSGQISKEYLKALVSKRDDH